jgi:hypothetical protein
LNDPKRCAFVIALRSAPRRQNTSAEEFFLPHFQHKNQYRAKIVALAERTRRSAPGNREEQFFMTRHDRKMNGEIRNGNGAVALTPVDASLPDASWCTAESELNEQSHFAIKESCSPRRSRRTQRKSFNRGLRGYRGSENAFIFIRHHSLRSYPRHPQSILFLLRALRDPCGEPEFHIEKPETNPTFTVSLAQPVCCAKTKANALTLHEPIMRNSLGAQELA